MRTAAMDDAEEKEAKRKVKLFFLVLTYAVPASVFVAFVLLFLASPAATDDVLVANATAPV